MEKRNHHQNHPRPLHPPRQPRRTRSWGIISALTATLLLGVALGACGQADDLAVYPGTWQVNSGVITMTCPGGTTTETFNTMVTFLRSGDESLVRTEQGHACPYRFDLSDHGLALVPGQSCETSGFDEDGYHYTVTTRPLGWTLQPVGEEALQESYNLSLTIRYDGRGTMCTANVVSTLYKLGQ